MVGGGGPSNSGLRLQNRMLAPIVLSAWTSNPGTTCLSRSVPCGPDHIRQQSGTEAPTFIVKVNPRRANRATGLGIAAAPFERSGACRRSDAGHARRRSRPPHQMLPA